MTHVEPTKGSSKQNLRLEPHPKPVFFSKFDFDDDDDDDFYLPISADKAQFRGFHQFKTVPVFYKAARPARRYHYYDDDDDFFDFDDK